MVSRTFSGFDQSEQFFQTLMERNVHEIRQINRDIIAANEDVGHFLESVPSSDDARVRVGNLRALSEILGSRTDFLDYLSNPDKSSARLKIKPYSKFDKAVRSLRKRAQDRGINLSHYGNSVGQILGLPVFEVIPFSVIENAIKFSPRDYPIRVEFSETSGMVRVKVQNHGPLLSPEEVSRVFESGFRGARAIRAGIPGSGIGLFFLKDLIERHHKGQFEFRQIGDVVEINALSYRLTEVLLDFPRVT